MGNPEPLTCSCNPFACNLPKVDVSIARKTYTAGADACGVRAETWVYSTFARAEFGKNDLNSVITNCECGSSFTYPDAQGAYNSLLKTKSQFIWEFDGVTNTTTWQYGEPDATPKFWNFRNVDINTTCITSDNQTGSPSTTCTPTAPGWEGDQFNLFLFGGYGGNFYRNPVSTRLEECQSLTRNPTSVSMNAWYSIERPYTQPSTGLVFCDGSGYEPVSRTYTESISGDDVNGEAILARAKALLDAYEFPPLTDIYSEIPQPWEGGSKSVYADIEVRNSCPSVTDIEFCGASATPNNEAVATDVVFVSKTRFQVVYDLPVTCFLKIWTARYKTKTTTEFAYENGEILGEINNTALMGDLTITSTTVALPQRNNSCIDREIQEGLSPFSVPATDVELNGILTVEEATTEPPEECCSLTPLRTCSFGIQSRFSIIGWSIIEEYEPIFYTIDYDPEIDPDPQTFLGNSYYATRISSSSVIFSPFNNYAPTLEEQQAFNDWLNAYNASRGSAAP